jgi:hypothetical protein
VKVVRWVKVKKGARKESRKGARLRSMAKLMVLMFAYAVFDEIER